MKLESLYINGISSVSIQQPLTVEGIFSPVSYNEVHVRCMEPVFKDFLDPMAARRMSKIIKRAIVSAKTALKESNIEKPDAIITGTGLGCVEDTEKFLEAMIKNDEQFIQPTYFIQSTHNTISSQIAINMHCNGYNNTYIHRGVSFENALMDAFLLFNKNEISTALVAGNDEMTPAYFILLKRLGYWKENVEDTINITRNSATGGSFSGEGSISFVLSNAKSNTSYAKLIGFDLFYKPQNISEKIKSFLAENDSEIDDIDLVITGINGDMTNDQVYSVITQELFDRKQIGCFKNICGEFYTASAYGLMVAAACLKNRTIPAHITLNNTERKDPYKILIYNHFQNKDHSLTLLSRC
jgi:3-oxoacyl-[acyl-carrier-protein] synthase II